MKVHLYKNKNSEMSACNRHRYFGTNRTTELYLEIPEVFYRTALRDRSFVCETCLKEFNRKVKEAKNK